MKGAESTPKCEITIVDECEWLAWRQSPRSKRMVAGGGACARTAGTRHDRTHSKIELEMH
jgi:hypothetical protein